MNRAREALEKKLSAKKKQKLTAEKDEEAEAAQDLEQEVDALGEEAKNNGHSPTLDGEQPAEKRKIYYAIHRVEDYLSDNYHFQHNVIKNCIEVAEFGSEEYEELNIDDLYRELKKEGIKYSLSDLKSLMKSKFVELMNPFEYYFEGLQPYEPQREPDYIDQLAAYIQVKSQDQERFRNHFKKHLVRTVACALQDNFVNKQCLVLTGGQDAGKSYFCRWLIPAELKDYYTENIGTDKDSLIALGQNFMINMDELATVGKAELNALKSIFSKEMIKVRKPYAERPSIAPRRASFIGNTNETEFLNDHTGTVRWLCFEIEGIDWAYSKEIEVDHIWRQALYLSKDPSFNPKLDRGEIEENEQANKRFQISTPEMDLISAYFYPPSPAEIESKKAVFYTATDILEEIIDRTGNKIRLHKVNVGRALTALGFPKASKRKGQMPLKGYYVMPNEERLEDEDKS